MTPLDEFIDRWQALMPLPFIDAINTQVEMDQLPETWGSAMITSSTRADLTMGSQVHVEETGEIVVALFARSGSGRSSLDAAVVALRDIFHGYMTADNTIQFRAVVGPQDIDAMAEGEWWRLGFLVPYVVWSVRTEPAPIAFAQDWAG